MKSELLENLIGNKNSMGNSKSTLSKNALSQKTNPNDNIISDINEKESNKSEICTELVAILIYPYEFRYINIASISSSIVVINLSREVSPTGSEIIKYFP